MSWGDKPKKTKGFLPSTKLKNERKERSARAAVTAAEQQRNTPKFSRSKRDK